MDVYTVHTILTVVSFVIFIAIVLWAYSDRRKTAFDEAARLPFDEEDGEIGNGERI